MHQPYHPFAGIPNSAKGHPLWLLQSMDIEDKHKLVNVVAVAASFRRLIPDCHDLEIVETREELRGNLKHGQPIARYKVIQTGSNPYMHVKGEGSFSVVFGEGTLAEGEGLFRTCERVALPQTGF